MSQINGDKARYAKARMKKLRHREAMRALKNAVVAKPAPVAKAKPA